MNYEWRRGVAGRALAQLHRERAGEWRRPNETSRIIRREVGYGRTLVNITSFI